jgi:methylglutaconyl-CoA hydratase
MTRYSTVSLRIDPCGVAELRLDRPDKRNAFSAEMIAEITDAAAHLGADSAIRAVVLSGAGAVFCAGGDLDWMRAQIGADRAGRMDAARRLAAMLSALNTLPKPLIGRIQGGAFGGGVGLACVCDVAVAGSEARFGLTETRLGLIPATIGPYVVARLGEGAARRVMLSARIFGADEAVRLGLVAAAVPAAELDAAMAAEVAPFLSVSTEAVGRAKALVRSLGPPIDAAVIEDTARRLADAWETPEAAQGIDAFLARRAPPWAAEAES